MTSYVEVAQALVRAGYVSDADVDAAAAMLGDALVAADIIEEAAAEEIVAAILAAGDD